MPHDRPEHDNNIVCGNLLLWRNERRAYWKEVDVGLTAGEYDIVHLLASNVGHYQTYRAIHDLQYYEGFMAGMANVAFEQTFEHPSSAYARSSANSIRPSPKSRLSAPSDIVGAV
jgi:hypothetical protein